MSDTRTGIETACWDRRSLLRCGAYVAASRAALRKGTPSAEAWKKFKVPERLGQWALYRPDMARFAIEPWEREPKGS